jgi:hypothetical protein
MRGAYAVSAAVAVVTSPIKTVIVTSDRVGGDQAARVSPANHRDASVQVPVTPGPAAPAYSPMSAMAASGPEWQADPKAPALTKR